MSRPINRRLIAVIGIVVALLATIAFLLVRAGQSHVAEAQPESVLARDEATRSIEGLPAEAAKPSAVAANAPDTSQRIAVDTQRLEVLVVDPAQAPVSNALIVLFRKSRVIASASTEADGVARFDAKEGKADYVLSTAGWALMRGELELAAGRRTVSLVEREVVAGMVLVDGAAPREALELSLDNDAQTEITRELPRPVLALVRAGRETSRRLFEFTDPTGAFLFHGLARDNVGHISWNGPYFLDKEGTDAERRSARVSSPSRDVALRLVTGTEMHLRVVEVGGAPVPFARVRFNMARSSVAGSAKATRRERADADGRVVSVFAAGPPSTFSVVVHRANGEGERTHELALPASPVGRWDVGDLALRETRALRVLVLDSDRKPISRAEVLPWPSRTSQLDGTNEEGRLTRLISLDLAELLIEAEGFECELVSVPEDDVELEVVLVKPCILEFEIPGFEAEAHQMSVDVQGTSPLFQQETRMGRAKLSSSLTFRTDKDGSTSAKLSARKDGRWKFVGLRSGQPLRASLTQGSGGALCVVDIAPLAVGEHRIVPLQLASLRRLLRVRVLDPDLNPIEGAWVRICDPNDFPARSQTSDSRGEVEMNWFHADRCMVFVGAIGFPAKSIFLSSVPSGALEVVLDKPRSVEVELVTRDGSTPHGVMNVWGYDESVGGGQQGVPLGAGRFRLDRLPSGEVMIEASNDEETVPGLVRIGDSRSTILHDTSNSFGRIVLGETHGVWAKWSATEEQRGSLWSVAIAEPSAERDLMRSRMTQFDADNEMWSMIPAPRPGAYDVWLVKRSAGLHGVWERFGKPTRVTVGAGDGSLEVVLKP